VPEFVHLLMPWLCSHPSRQPQEAILHKRKGDDLAFCIKYCYEAHALPAQQWIGARGAPSRLNLVQLETDLKAIASRAGRHRLVARLLMRQTCEATPADIVRIMRPQSRAHPPCLPSNTQQASPQRCPWDDLIPVGGSTVREFAVAVCFRTPVEESRSRCTHFDAFLWC
jgi:hypothetical protein